MLVTMMSSPTRDDAAEATWPQRDIDAKSCWQQCHQVIIGDDPTGATWPRRDVDAESCW
jgi:hypothetical protein